MPCHMNLLSFPTALFSLVLLISALLLTATFALAVGVAAAAAAAPPLATTSAPMNLLTSTTASQQSRGTSAQACSFSRRCRFNSRSHCIAFASLPLIPRLVLPVQLHVRGGQLPYDCRTTAALLPLNCRSTAAQLPLYFMGFSAFGREAPPLPEESLPSPAGFLRKCHK